MAGDDVEPGALVHLAVLSVKERAARCRVPDTGEVITLRPDERWRYGVRSV